MMVNNVFHKNAKTVLLKKLVLYSTQYIPYVIIAHQGMPIVHLRDDPFQSPAHIS